MSVGGQYVSLSISYAPGGNFSFSTIPADPKKWTRPARIYDVHKYVYKVETYNTVGTLIRTRTDYQYKSVNTWYKALNK